MKKVFGSGLFLLIMSIAVSSQAARGGGKPGGTSTPNAAFISTKNDGTIVVSNADGSGISTVFSNSAVFAGFDRPTWTPGGNGFVVGSNYGIYLQGFDNTNGIISGAPQLVTTFSWDYGARPQMSPVPAPDGKYKIVFQDYSPSGELEIFVINTDGSDRMLVTGGDNSYESNPRWAPTGDRLVFDVWDYDSGTFVDILDFGFNAGSGQLEVTNRFHLTIGLEEFYGFTGDYYPIWTKDGSNIIASATPLDGVHRDLFMIPVNNPSAYYNITNTPDYSEWEARLSPDGTQFVYHHGGAEPCRLTTKPKSPTWGGIAVQNIDGRLIGSCRYGVVSGLQQIPDWK